MQDKGSSSSRSSSRENSSESYFDVKTAPKLSMAVQKGQNGLSVSHSRNISIKNHSLSQFQNQKNIIQTPKKQNGSKIKEERKATPHGSPAQSQEGIYDQIQNGNQTYILQRQRVSRQQKTLDERMVMVDKDLTKLKKSLGKNAVLGRSTSLPQNLIALGERYTSASKDQLKQLISNEPKRKSRSIQRENSLLELYSVKSLEDEIVDTEKSDLALQKNLEMKIQPKDFALKSKNELLSGIIAEDNTSKSNAAEEEDPTTIRQAQRNSTSHNQQNLYILMIFQLYYQKIYFVKLKPYLKIFPLTFYGLIQ